VTNSNSQIQDQTTSSTQPKIIEVLAALRSEWENAANGQSLVNVNGSIGLILFDIIGRLGLSSEDTSVLLGSKLSTELTELMADQSIEL
jgi:hypothetical protein